MILEILLYMSPCPVQGFVQDIYLKELLNLVKSAFFNLLDISKLFYHVVTKIHPGRFASYLHQQLLSSEFEFSSV